MSTITSFADFLQDFRDRQRMPLRRFCEKHGLDPGTHSKMERGLRPPPKSPEKQEQLAQQLGIEEGSDDWAHFMETAAISAGQIPQDILSDAELAAKLPLAFRTIRGEKLNEEQLDQLIGLMRENHGAENTMEG